MALAVMVGALAVPSAASADSVGPAKSPDLSAPPDTTFPCSNICTLFGLEGPIGLVDPGPTEVSEGGTVTQVQVRTQVPVPIELVQMELTGDGQIHVKSFHPLGETDGSGIFPFDGLSIPFGPGTFFGVKAEPQGGGATIDGYNTPGQNGTGVLDPSPSAGSVDPLDAVIGEYQPAIRVQFVREDGNVRVPEEDDDDPPPGNADVQVVKRSDARPGRSPAVGGTTSFTIYVKNNGPETANGVVLRDRFGTGLIHERTKVFRKTAAKNAACGGNFGKRGGGLLVCGIGQMAPGATAVFRVFMKVSGRGTKGAGRGSKRRERNLAIVASRSPADPNLKNNRDAAAVRVRGGIPTCRGRAIVGDRRNNLLRGTRRADTIFGLRGNDRLIGRAGGDCLFGGDGNDIHVGGPGRDYMSGENGNDRFFARDRRPDTIVCGKGRDFVIADRRLDRVAKDCERVRRI